MKKKKIGVICLILVIIIAIIAGIKVKQNHDDNTIQEIQPVKVSSKTVPTFFFHGWGSQLARRRYNGASNKKSRSY